MPYEIKEQYNSKTPRCSGRFVLIKVLIIWRDLLNIAFGLFCLIFNNYCYIIVVEKVEKALKIKGYI